MFGCGCKGCTRDLPLCDSSVWWEREKVLCSQSSSYSDGKLRTVFPAAPMTFRLRLSICSWRSSPTQFLNRRRTALCTAEWTRNCSSSKTTMFWTARRTSAWMPDGRSASLSRTRVPSTSSTHSKSRRVSGEKCRELTVLQKIFQANTSCPVEMALSERMNRCTSRQHTNPSSVLVDSKTNKSTIDLRWTGTSVDLIPLVSCRSSGCSSVF